MPPHPKRKKKRYPNPIPCRTLFPLPPMLFLGLSYPSIPLLSSFPPRCPTSSPYSGNAPSTEYCPPAPAQIILRPRMAVLSTSVGTSTSCVVPCPVW